MPDEKRKHLINAVGALKRELESSRFRQLAPERAFIQWYVLARYGEHAKCEITDGSSDGGIDAIVTEGEVKVVLQSKYEPSLKLRTISSKELSNFEAIATRFFEPEKEEEFTEWLQMVRSELRAKYKALRRLALARPDSIRFDFVTSKRVMAWPDENLHVIDIERVAPLWQLYEEGFTPPVESVDIEFEDVWSIGSAKDRFRNYVGLADTRAFLRLMDKDEHERLFSQNVRTDLRTRINDDIRRTYEKEPGTFWLGNNGIYIVCKQVLPKGRTLRLIYPSIINGSQTLHALHSSDKSRHACRVLVRVLEMDIVNQRKLLNDIVRRTNSQNPMRPMNLVAHEPEQLNIARFLDSVKIFYERREKEWKNEKKALLHGYIPVGLKEVAQWVGVTTDTVGIGAARNKVASLFHTGQYENLFGRFDEKLTSDDYRRLATAIWCGLLIRRYMSTLPKTKRRGQITQLLLVKAVFEAVENSQHLSSRIMQLLRERSYQEILSNPVSRTLSAIIRDVLAEQVAKQREDLSLDLSNFFKRDDLTERAYEKICSASRLNLLRHELEKTARSS
ncbi:MAG TPA: AIPR family protein [Pyrinomonadaceae bacterium]|jgi:hypothetical protein